MTIPKVVDIFTNIIHLLTVWQNKSTNEQYGIKKPQQIRTFLRTHGAMHTVIGRFQTPVPYRAATRVALRVPR